MTLSQGRAIAKDRVEASQWAQVAAESGDKDAASLVKEIQLFATAADFQEGKRRAQEFLRSTGK